VGGYLDLAGGVLVAGGCVGVWWAYKRSLRALESLGDADPVPEPPAISDAERAAVRSEAQPEVAELQALAQKIESGAPVTPAEHARIAQLVGELGTLEHRAQS
jgi:hypothetical protein